MVGSVAPRPTEDHDGVTGLHQKEIDFPLALTTDRLEKLRRSERRVSAEDDADKMPRMAMPDAPSPFWASFLDLARASRPTSVQ